jgi:hypothetical protein
MSNKKINELETYDITKATEQDVIPVVETKDDANETKKLPVSDLRNIIAKFNLFNIVAMVISLIKSFMEGRTGEVFHCATAFNNAVEYIKTNWYDLSTGTPNMTNLQTLKTTSAAAIRQTTDDAIGWVKKIWHFGSKGSDYWYLCRNSKTIYNFRVLEGTQPDIIYIVRYRENDKDYSSSFVSLESAQSFAAQRPGSTMEIADWAGGADKQPYVFDWTKDRVADLVEAMDINEFIEGFNPFSTFVSKVTEMGYGINKLSQAVQEMSPVVQVLASANLEARIAALEQALSQAQNSGSTGSPSNGGENQGDTEPDNGEDAALRSRAEALYSTVSGDDTSSMSLEQIISAMEQYLGITPDPGASYADRLDAIEAAGSQM